ncbi:MAG TPA: hypothetical protein VGD64_11125 [Acidisarcina sp.]
MLSACVVESERARRRLRDEHSGSVVTFKDIPEAITQGDTEAEALAAAKNVLGTFSSI